MGLEPWLDADSGSGQGFKQKEVDWFEESTLQQGCAVQNVDRLCFYLLSEEIGLDAFRSFASTSTAEAQIVKIICCQVGP